MQFTLSAADVGVCHLSFLFGRGEGGMCTQSLPHDSPHVSIKGLSAPVWLFYPPFSQPQPHFQHKEMSDLSHYMSQVQVLVHPCSSVKPSHPYQSFLEVSLHTFNTTILLYLVQLLFLTATGSILINKSTQSSLRSYQQLSWSRNSIFWTLKDDCNCHM